MSEDAVLDVRSSPIHGAGVFARRAIAKGEVIGIYEGRRYPAEHVVETLTDSEITYLFGLSDGTTIDGAEGGNATRHLNHSCAPNCEAVEIAGDADELVLEIRARRSVAAGAELFIDYELTVDETDDGLYACLCGARRCRGTMAAQTRSS